jgi:23S rRNA G2445 N2-methylase RlmL
MCGSATLLTEALTFNVPLKLRPFSFETAPFYRGKILRLSESIGSTPITKAIGIDINGELLDKVRQEISISKLPIELIQQDSLVADPPKTSGEIFMICNPPYGERIKLSGQKGKSLKNYLDIFLSRYQPYRFCWVVPSDLDDLFLKIKGYSLQKQLRFRNGGLAVSMWVWERLD